MIKTRIAPSPTGYPHIGTIYQALFDFAFARKNNGHFVVRIEDTDRSRLVDDAEDAIYSALDWFGLSEDESPRKDGPAAPYRQSERLGIYHEYTQKLLDGDHAWFDYYKKEEAGVKKDYSQSSEKTSGYEERPDGPTSVADFVAYQDKYVDWVIRMRVPKGKKITVKDEIRGEIEFDSDQVTEQVLLKSDGFPTYHLAVVVDDHLMGITHIVRAEEWLPSSPKHVLLYQYFGWDMPPLYHTATLRNPDKSKLSKRHGHTSVKWYKENGFLPEAILNFLALLGWTHPDEKEIFSRDEFIRLFDLKDIKPVPPIFDLKKLEWINGEYIRMMPDEDLKEKVLVHDESLRPYADQLDPYIPLAKTRMKKLSECKDLIMPFLEKPSVALSAEEKEQKEKLKTTLSQISDWTLDVIIASIKEFNTQNGVNFKSHYRTIIGRDAGLPLGDVFVILGKEKTLELLS